jgi:hypothetical protein
MPLKVLVFCSLLDPNDYLISSRLNGSVCVFIVLNVMACSLLLLVTYGLSFRVSKHEKGGWVAFLNGDSPTLPLCGDVLVTGVPHM